MASSPFHFKKFSVFQEGVAHPVGTDGVLLGAWADTSGANRILDIGTGTGLIAMMLAQRSDPSVRITAIDIHAGSVVCANGNFDGCPWSDRLEVMEARVQDFAATSSLRYDLIVSNPPFFSELTVSPDAERSLGRHTGTLSIGDLLEAVTKLLSMSGKCCIILPEKEGKRLCEHSVLFGLYCTREVAIRSRPGRQVERLLLQLERDPGRFIRETLEINDGGKGYSAAYKALTADFYLGV